MARYIDADKLYDDITISPYCTGCAVYDADDVINTIRIQPTADVVEVVRCKDCKYYNPNYKQFECDIPYNRCDHPAQQFDVECYDMWLETDPDDYCSYGERKDT